MPPAERLGHYLPTWKLTRKQRDNYSVKHIELIMRQPGRPWKMRPRKLKEAGIRDLWHEQDQDIIRMGGRPAADYTSVPGQDGQNQRLITEREAKVKESGEKSRARKAALALLEKERNCMHSKTAPTETLEHDSAESESEDSGQDKDGDMGGKEDNAGSEHESTNDSVPNRQERDQVPVEEMRNGQTVNAGQRLHRPKRKRGESELEEAHKRPRVDAPKTPVDKSRPELEGSQKDKDVQMGGTENDVNASVPHLRKMAPAKKKLASHVALSKPPAANKTTAKSTSRPPKGALAKQPGLIVVFGSESEENEDTTKGAGTTEESTPTTSPIAQVSVGNIASEASSLGSQEAEITEIHVPEGHESCQSKAKRANFGPGAYLDPKTAAAFPTVHRSDSYLSKLTDKQFREMQICVLSGPRRMQYEEEKHQRLLLEAKKSGIELSRNPPKKRRYRHRS